VDELPVPAPQCALVCGGGFELGCKLGMTVDRRSDPRDGAPSTVGPTCCPDLSCLFSCTVSVPSSCRAACSAACALPPSTPLPFLKMKSGIQYTVRRSFNLGDSAATTVYWSEGGRSRSYFLSSHLLSTHTQSRLFWATRTCLCAVVSSWPARPHLVVGVSCLGEWHARLGCLHLAGPRLHVRRVQWPRAHNISLHLYIPSLLGRTHAAEVRSLFRLFRLASRVRNSNVSLFLLNRDTTFILPVTRDAGLTPDTNPAVEGRTIGGRGHYGTVTC
jgi:hypothetical protein